MFFVVCACEGSHLGSWPDVRLWCEILEEVGQTEGISEKQKQNKDIPFTGLQRKLSHSRTTLERKYNPFPFCSGFSQKFKREVMTGLEVVVVKKKKVPVPSDAFCPRSHGCSFRRGWHSPHSGPPLLCRGSNSCFIILQSRLRETKSSPSWSDFRKG